jgi:hypothetical protein
MHYIHASSRNVVNLFRDPCSLCSFSSGPYCNEDIECESVSVYKESLYCFLKLGMNCMRVRRQLGTSSSFVFIRVGLVVVALCAES